jgi:predicted phosphodiesterase
MDGCASTGVGKAQSRGMMIRFCAVAAVGLLISGAAVGAPGQSPPAPLSSWVQMAPGGVAEVRAVVGGKSCPEISIDKQTLPMRLRASAAPAFPNLLCAATLPKTAASASIWGRDLPLPRARADRIVVIGDTGCRIKGFAVQACNDPARWPFPRVVAAAAKAKPDLVIHVGDYLYREAACPRANAGCAGSPSGDDWPAWAADFFTAAAPLLAVAPFVFVRGNHEECARSGTGWLMLLGPLAFDSKALCTDHVAPWALPLGGVSLAVMDDAHAPDLYAPRDLAGLYRADLTSISRLAPSPVWLVMHRPIWGLVELGFGIVVGGNRTMMAAQDENGIPNNISLLLAGHIHTFEAINYAKDAPPQIIAGEGGDLLDKAPRDLSGRSVGALKIASGMSLSGYGFLLFTREADRWLIHVMTQDGAQEALCSFANRHLDCHT